MWRGFRLRRAATSAEPWPVTANVTLATAADTRVTLVLGLQWRSILGRNLSRQARQRARVEGARAWVHAGGRAESVGLQRQGARPVAQPRVAYAAAQAFARHAGAGVHLACLPLPEPQSGWWLALVRDGQVQVGGDHLGADPAELGAVWSQWQARYGVPGAWWGECAALGPLVVDPMRPLGWHDLARAVGPDSVLQLRTSPALRYGWAGALGLALAVALAAWWAPTVLSPPADSPEQVAAHAEAEQLARQASWQAAWHTWEQQTPVLTEAGIKQLAAMLLQVPARTAGWGLQGVACEWSAGSAWQCQADYRRQHVLGRQAGLRAALPDSWQVQWLGLEQGRASWQASFESTPLPRQALPLAQSTWVPWADTWLALMPLWQRLEWGRREPVVLAPAPPAVAAGHGTVGAAASASASASGVSRRSLVLAGPLRSLALLPPAMLPQTHWQRLSLQWQPGAVVRGAGPASSSLNLTLQGVVHERSDESTSLAVRAP